MRAFAVLAVAVLLAGCSDSPSSGDEGLPSATDGTQHGGHADGTHLLAPEWEVGDFWTLESQQGNGPFSHVVSADRGDDWTVDTDSQDIAHFDARFDISFLGQVRKSDLAGSQGTTRVEFLKFPLVKDLNWTTTWDGEPMTVQALDVRDGKATLQAHRANGTRYAEYVYDSKPGYFTRFTFYAPDGEAVGFEWTLSQAGSGFSSPLLRWTLDELFTSTGPIPSGAGGTFLVEPGYTDLWIDVDLQCAGGAVLLAVGPPDGPANDRGYAAEGPCPLQNQDSYSLPPPTQDEQWGYALTSAPTTAGTFEIHVFGRTSVTFAAGQAPT